MEILSILKHFMTDSNQQVKFHRHIKKIDNLDKNHAQLFDILDEIYTLFPEKSSVNTSEIRAYLTSKFPNRDHQYLVDVAESAMDQTIGKEVTLKLIESAIEYQMASKLMATCAAVISRQKTGVLLNETDQVTQEYSDLLTGADRPDQLQDCDMTFEEAIRFRATDSGIKWPLAILNNCLGGVDPSLGLVIARPDTGKTSFILNCMAYFASQIKGTDHQLLYCGNEEGIIGLKARLGVSLLGVTTEWAENNPREFGQRVTKHGGDCIRFHGGVRSTRDVETLLKRYEPIVTVLDQLPKFVLPGNKDEGPKGLANVYGWFRDKAKDYNTMMMGVAQAGASGKQWINIDDINGSKTDVPGELDWGIGIGMVDDTGMESARFFNIFKNKQKYGRKGRAETVFFPEKCRYKDV